MLKYILYFFGLELPNGVTPFIEYGFNVSLVCLVILLCFINVIGYLIALYFIQTKDFETKYPKFKGIVNYFKKSSWLFVISEALIGFSFLIFIIFLGFYPLFSGRV